MNRAQENAVNALLAPGDSKDHLSSRATKFQAIFAYPATAARAFDGFLRRLAGEGNDILRYFLWAVVPLVLLLMVGAGVWAFFPAAAPPTPEHVAAATGEAPPPSPPAPRSAPSIPLKLAPMGPQVIEAGKPLILTATPLRLQPIEAQTAEAGKVLTLTVAVENPQEWKGNLRYGLGTAPAGAVIDAQTGVLTWAPGPDQAPGQHVIMASVTTADGRSATTSFAVTLVRPPAPLRADVTAETPLRRTACNMRSTTAGRPGGPTMFARRWLSPPSMKRWPRSTKRVGPRIFAHR